MRFYWIVLFTVLALATCSIDYEGRFEQFKAQHGKNYVGEEHDTRFLVFKNNVDMIEEHNAQGLSWTMEMNEFGDLTGEEFKAIYTGLNVQRSNSPRSEVDLEGLFTTPDSKDWTTQGKVTAVKNQGQCGSCWAFSTTGSLEGAVAIKTGKLVSLSEQQLVDCSKAEGNLGCNGGLMDSAFEFIEKNNGICAESSYPYKGKDGTCLPCSPVSRVASYVDVPADNEIALKAAVALNPVSVAIEADQFGFQFYRSGVFTGRCGTNLDHGVLVVGYGTDSSGKDYWKVKNSWGGSWGMKGYILLERNVASKSGQCGVAMQASYPIAQ